ncbi:uncharacterized protein LOC114720042 [Neltuma alba]|uniref:uncharacterized protein LOC114720042 n=1 Tax=Neltuma alba TaxID=207710 RepID=UPI0010A42CA3|nr:uncharacterized protein LOC114720042 [Prosopis alba]
MGQRLNKLTSGGEDSQKKEELMKECYEKYLKDKTDCKPGEFYRAICDAVEKLNSKRGYTQVRALNADELEKQYKHYCKGDKPTDEEFRKMMKEILEEKIEVTGVGLKDTLLYIFGVPASATFIKNALMPSLVSNEVLIPGLTSLTVLVLAKLNKI